MKRLASVGLALIPTMCFAMSDYQLMDSLEHAGLLVIIAAWLASFLAWDLIRRALDKLGETEPQNNKIISGVAVGLAWGLFWREILEALTYGVMVVLGAGFIWCVWKLIFDR